VAVSETVACAVFRRGTLYLQLAVVKALVAIWESINLQLKHLLAEVKHRAEQDPYEPIYRAVGGFGALTATAMKMDLTARR